MSSIGYGYKKTLCAVNFRCDAPHATAVSVVGDFNEWDPKANPMKRMPDRAWLLTINLKHGHHRYAFLVDGILKLDAQALGITSNEKGERVSLVAVS